jgi:hydroxymethylglutaryl-CoA lyase
VRHFEVGSFLPAKTFPQFADVRDIIGTVASLPGAYGIALTLNERGVNEALASGVAEVASVVSATEEHSQANANRSRESAIANVRRLCELRDASAHKPVVNSAISMALGCSIVGAVDPAEVLRLTEKLFEAGVDMVAIADTVGYAGPKQVGELTAAAVKIAGTKPICIHLHDTRGMGIANASAALDAGARVLDGSLGGLGGCPFAPGDRQRRVRGSRVPVREQGVQDGYRYRETGRGALDIEIGDTRRGALWRAGPRRIAARVGEGGVVGAGAPHYSRVIRSRSALPTTLTDDSAIAAAAMIGDSSRPKAG